MSTRRFAVLVLLLLVTASRHTGAQGAPSAEWAAHAANQYQVAAT